MKKITANYVVDYRRKRQSKTDYRRRLNILKTVHPRLVIRKYSRNFVVQLVQYNPDGDKILAGANAQTLKKFGWNAGTGNSPAAYLVGYIVGKEAVKKNHKEAVLDLGLQTSTKGSRIYAGLKGALDAGMSINHSPEMIPSEDKINGKQIDAFRKSSLSKLFQEVKGKVK